MSECDFFDRVWYLGHWRASVLFVSRSGVTFWHTFSVLQNEKPYSDVFFAVEEMRKLFLDIFVVFVCVSNVILCSLTTLTTRMEDSWAMDVSSDTESCENEDTGLNETITDINFDPHHE